MQNELGSVSLSDTCGEEQKKNKKIFEKIKPNGCGHPLIDRTGRKPGK